MTALIAAADIDLRAVALTLYILVVVVIVLVVTTVDHRKHGNEAYRGRVDAIIDDALPREDARAKWEANRAEQRQ